MSERENWVFELSVLGFLLCGGREFELGLWDFSPRCGSLASLGLLFEAKLSHQPYRGACSSSRKPFRNLPGSITCQADSIAMRPPTWSPLDCQRLAGRSLVQSSGQRRATKRGRQGLPASREVAPVAGDVL